MLAISTTGTEGDQAAIRNKVELSAKKIRQCSGTPMTEKKVHKYDDKKSKT
jgi:hypothetical protein